MKTGQTQKLKILTASLFLQLLILSDEHLSSLRPHNQTCHFGGIKNSALRNILVSPEPCASFHRLGHCCVLLLS